MAVAALDKQFVSCIAMRAETKRRIARYWGYILLVVLYFAWFRINADPVILIIMSLALVVYFLFQAPAPCCALNRDGVSFCKNNARGLLRGCHLEAHKWENAKVLASRQSWARFGRGVFRKFSGGATTISAFAGVVSAVAAVISLVM